MKSFLAIFLLTLLSWVHSYQQLMPPTTTTAEMFPFYATIKVSWGWCNGALISKNFVLTYATCVENGTIQNIFLGFSRNPQKEDNRYHKNGQTFKPKQIYIHEDFGYLAYKSRPKHPINDFALIKLDKNVVLSQTVKPISIASPDDFPILPETFINVIGFPNYHSYDVDDNLKYSTVQERDIYLCELFHSSLVLKRQEGCVKHKGVERIEFAGPYVVNGILIGLNRDEPTDTECYFTPHCKGDDVYLSLEPALLWIFRISGVVGVNGGKVLEKENPFWKPEITQAGSQTNLQCPPPSNDGACDIIRDAQNLFCTDELI